MDMLRWLYGLQHFGVKLGLASIRALLAELGHPERAYPSVLIGGTNGKGSVSAMVDAMLQASGVRAGLYTSPHLVRPNERIRLAGRDIETDELNRGLAQLRACIERALAEGRLAAHPSFFEVLTAVALRAFADQDMRAAVLEVGLGGRLDATNAVDARLAVVVSVDLDHTKILGDTVERIAAEKAGIVKSGRPVVSGVVRQSALSVLQRTCEERGARLVDGRSAARLIAEADGSFTLRTPRGLYTGLRLPLPGRHQIDNARIALAAFELFAGELGLTPDPHAVREGLASVRWPGRLQWIEPTSAGLPRLLLDGAHNAAGARTLAAYLAQLPDPPRTILFGATEGRSPRELVAPLAPWVRRAVVTRVPVGRAIEPEVIAGEAWDLFDCLEAVRDPREALERAAGLAGQGGSVLVTGSLYLVGEVLGQLTGEKVPGPVAM